MASQDISEFADCLMEMHGVAHSIDIARLRQVLRAECIHFARLNPSIHAKVSCTHRHEQQRTARKLEQVLRRKAVVWRARCNGTTP